MTGHIQFISEDYSKRKRQSLTNVPAGNNESIGDQYYPTGRVMRDGRLQPETVDANDEPEEDNGPGEENPIGVWGRRHLRSIRQYKKPLYSELYGIH